MSVPDSAAAGTGVLISKFRLLRPFSMTPQQPTSLSSPTMPPSTSRSEKLLRDALLRDERERQQQSPPMSPPTHKRRHSHIPTSTYSASTSATWEDYGNQLERDGDHSPVRKLLFHGGDPEGNNRPQHRQSHHYQQQRQHSPTSYRRSSPSPKPSGRSTSTSPSPSPLYMRRRQAGPISPNIPTTTLTGTSPTNATNILRNQSFHNTPKRYGSTYPSQAPLPITPHEQVLRGKLERVLAVEGARGDENEVRDEQGSCPWRLGAQSTAGAGGSSSGSITSASFNNSSQSHLQTPQTAEIQARTYHLTSTPNRRRPPSPHPPGHSPSLSHKPLRYQTDPNSHPPQSNPNSPRIPTTSSSSSVALNASGSGRSMRSSLKPTPLPLVLGDAVEGELRLPTPPPTPPSMACVSLGNVVGYVPSPYKTATANPTPNGMPVRTQKKEGELEMRRPTQGPAAAFGGNKGKEKEPLRPLESSSVSSRRERDITITQQSLQALRSTNVHPNNTDGHSEASTESNSTSGSSLSHSRVVGYTSGYCACSSHSSLDGPIQPQLQRSFSADIYTRSIPPPPPHLSQSNSNPPSPTTNKPFNARKASTQCRAMQGYVSFASVEGLGEPPSLVGDGFDAAGSDADGGGGKGNGGKGRLGPFLPLGVWNAAWGWKKFLGVSAVEGQEQGVVV